MLDNISSIASVFCLSFCHWATVSIVIISTAERLVYLLGLQGDALLPWFLLISGAKILADVDERHAWMIRVAFILPSRVSV